METVCSSLMAWTKFRGEVGKEVGIQTGESLKGIHGQNFMKASHVVKLYFSEMVLGRWIGGERDGRQDWDISAVMEVEKKCKRKNTLDIKD